MYPHFNFESVFLDLLKLLLLIYVSDEIDQNSNKTNVMFMFYSNLHMYLKNQRHIYKGIGLLFVTYTKQSIL